MELSKQVITTALTVATNYLLLTAPSDDVLYELGRLYKSTESLTLAGEGLSRLVTFYLKI